MNIHYIMHASFEKIGIIEEWAKEQNHKLSGTHIYAGEKLPSPDTFDFLIIMGGPQSPLEIEQYPYLQDEINLITQAIQQNKFVLGFCLGAQLIAESLGAKTQRSPEKEVGMYPIELTSAGEEDPIFKHFPKQFDVMHWHNDMPGIAKEAVLLAKSAGCPQQAFRYRKRTYGLQFHMEITKACAKEMISHCANDLVPKQYVQTTDVILKSDFDLLNKRMKKVLDLMILN